MSKMLERNLRDRDPRQWLKKIRALKGFDKDVKIQTVCIVWWDYFSGRRGDERWPHLDRYLALYDVGSAPDTHRVVDGLVKLGYTRRAALIRMIKKGGGIGIASETR